MIKNEWKNLFKSKFLIIALIAVITIPTIYTTLFLGSMWDPYGKVSDLPVAVVNNDIPTTYNDKDINIGEKLVDKLKDNDSLSFNFVDSETASKGLEDGTYYMVINIPENFSENATTLLSEKPEKMVLDYSTNPSKNYIASKMSETALSKIQESIANEVTSVYADTVFEKLETLGDGFKTASDGSATLGNGINKLQDGSTKISDGLKTLSDSMLTFTDGTTTLSQGLNTYLSGVESVNEGAKSLSDGTKDLSDGASKLNSSVQEISIPTVSLSDEQKKNLKDTASAGVSSYSSQLSAGIGSAVSTSIKGNLTSDTTVNTISQGVLNDAKIKQMVGALVSAGYTEEQANALITGIVSSTLNGASTGITSDSITKAISPTVSSTMSSVAMATAEAGANAVVTQVNSTLGAFGTKFTELKSATKSLSEGAAKLNTGAATLYEGTSKLVANNSSLSSGVQSLSEGSNKISSGTSTLYDGSITLNDGLKSASDGTSTLTSSLSEASDKVSDNIANVTEDTSDMFASPVDASETQITTVENNGHAMAAYMMVVSIWVASMAFCTVYPLTKHNDKCKSGFKLWLSKASVMYPVSIIWACVMIAALHYINGFNPVDLKQTILVACVCGVTFISIVYFLNVTCGVVGNFFVLILMVIQLSGSTGTYPLELSGNFVSKINSYLPFTYAINSFRTTISGGVSIKNNLIVLLSIAAILIVLTIIFFEIKTRLANNTVTETEKLAVQA